VALGIATASSVSPPPGTHLPIQLITGGLQLGIDIGYRHRIEVIGYNKR
jgi:hypothetical protein